MCLYIYFSLPSKQFEKKDALYYVVTNKVFRLSFYLSSLYHKRLATQSFLIRVNDSLSLRFYRLLFFHRIRGSCDIFCHVLWHGAMCITGIKDKPSCYPCGFFIFLIFFFLLNHKRIFSPLMWTSDVFFVVVFIELIYHLTYYLTVNW